MKALLSISVLISFILKLELITITKLSHLDRFEREIKGNLEMAFLVAHL